MSIASSNLAQRIISSIILAPLVIGVLVYGGWAFAIFMGLVIAISLSEWINIVRKLDHRILYSVAGVFYFLTSFAALVVTRHISENGLYLCLTLMITVWGTDILAYVVGRLVGGPKMSPTISPKKTWSGFGGALAGAALCFWACLFFAPQFSTILPNNISMNGLSPIFVIGAGIAFGFVGQAGDLLVSMFKRKAGIKDSGNIIPGHGGLLDRIDSLLLVAPLFLAVCVHGL